MDRSKEYTPREVMGLIGVGDSLLYKLELQGKIVFDRHPVSGRKSIPGDRLAKQMAHLVKSENVAKIGARNNAADQARLQAAHDHLVAMGACCHPGNDTTQGPAQMGPDQGNANVIATPLKSDSLGQHDPDAALALAKVAIAKSRAKI